MKPESNQKISAVLRKKHKKSSEQIDLHGGKVCRDEPVVRVTALEDSELVLVDAA